MQNSINKPNLEEIGKIVRNMTTDYTSSPNYNAGAAEIVRQGAEDKRNAKLEYQTVITKPLPRVLPPKD